jgi:hypothetical protein
MLVDTDTDKDIQVVDDGAVLDLSKLPPNLTLRVDTDPPSIGSVTFRIDAGMLHTESIAPYSISSDDGRGNFAPWTLSVGAHTVQATPYDAADGGGRVGEPLEIDFTLTRGSAAGDADGGGADAGRDAGASSDGGLIDSGTALGLNPAIGADGGLVNFGDASVPGHGKDDDGCSCRVAGGGSGASGARGSWAMAALAIGLFARRRAQRSRRN